MRKCLFLKQGFVPAAKSEEVKNGAKKKKKKSEVIYFPKVTFIRYFSTQYVQFRRELQ